MLCPRIEVEAYALGEASTLSSISVHMTFRCSLFTYWIYDIIMFCFVFTI